MNTPENIIPILRKRDKKTGGICLLYITMFAVIMTTCFYEVPQTIAVLFAGFMLYAVIRSFIAGWQCSNLNRWIQENAFEKPPHLKKSILLPRVIGIYFSLWAALCYVGINVVSVQSAEETIFVFALRLIITIGFVLGLGIIAFLFLMPVVTGEHGLEPSFKSSYPYMCYKRDRLLATLFFLLVLMFIVLGGYWYSYIRDSAVSDASSAILSPYFLFPSMYLGFRTKFIQQFSKIRFEHQKDYVVGKNQKVIWSTLSLLFFALFMVSAVAVVYAAYVLITTTGMNHLLLYSGLAGVLLFVTYIQVFILYSPLSVKKQQES
jgi:hypothetical protein